MLNCKVIALCNQKGGVGKTTTCVNLGIGLAMLGKKVLLIDADAQGSTTLSLGIKKPDELSITIADILQMVIDDKPVPDGYGILHHEEGVDFMPANIDLSGMDVRLMNTMSRESVLKTYLDQIKNKYDYVLIDCMPSLGMMTINALAAADSVIIPAQPDFLSIRGMEDLLKTYYNVKKQINPKLKIDGILMTMVDSRTNFTKEIISRLRTQYGENLKVFKTEIPRSIKAVETTAEGRSIFAYFKSGKVAIAYDSLAKEVLENEKQRSKNRTESVR